MFDLLSDKLQNAFRTLGGSTQLTAEHIEEAIREVRRALLEADVSLKVVKLFISQIRQKALGADVIESVTPEQQFIKIVHDELVTILGGENVPLDAKQEQIQQTGGGTRTGGQLCSCCLVCKVQAKPLLVPSLP